MLTIGVHYSSPASYSDVNFCKINSSLKKFPFGSHIYGLYIGGTVGLGTASVWGAGEKNYSYF